MPNTRHIEHRFCISVFWGNKIKADDDRTSALSFLIVLNKPFPFPVSWHSHRKLDILGDLVSLLWTVPALAWTQCLHEVMGSDDTNTKAEISNFIPVLDRNP